jgi:hypothetical protein
VSVLFVALPSLASSAHLPTGWTEIGEGTAVLDPEQPRRALLLWGERPGATVGDLATLLEDRGVADPGFAAAELDGVFRVATGALRGTAVAGAEREPTRWAVVVAGDPDLPRGFLDASAIAWLHLNPPPRPAVEVPPAPSAKAAAERLGMPPDALALGPPPDKHRGRPYVSDGVGKLVSKLARNKNDRVPGLSLARRILKAEAENWIRKDEDALAILCDLGECGEALDVVRRLGTREAAARLACRVRGSAALPSDVRTDLIVYALGALPGFHATGHCLYAPRELAEIGRWDAFAHVVGRDAEGGAPWIAVASLETMVPEHPLSLGVRYDPESEEDGAKQLRSFRDVGIGDGSSPVLPWLHWAADLAADRCASAPEGSSARRHIQPSRLFASWRAGAFGAMDRAAEGCDFTPDKRFVEMLVKQAYAGRAPSDKYLDKRKRSQPTPRLVEYARVRGSALTMVPAYRTRAVALAAAAIRAWTRPNDALVVLGEMGEFQAGADALLDAMDEHDLTHDTRGRSYIADLLRWLRKCLVHGKVREVQPLLFREARLRKKILGDGELRGDDSVFMGAKLAALGDTMWAFELPDDAILAWRVAEEHGIRKLAKKTERQTSWEVAAEEAERRRLEQEQRRRETARRAKEAEIAADWHLEHATPRHLADVTEVTWPCGRARCWSSVERCEELATAVVEQTPEDPVAAIRQAEWACVQAKPMDDRPMEFRARRAKHLVALYEAACGLSSSTDVDGAYCGLRRAWEAEFDTTNDAWLARALREVADALNALQRTVESGGGGSYYEPEPESTARAPDRDKVLRIERVEHCEWSPSEDPNVCLALGTRGCPYSPERHGALNQLPFPDTSRGGHNCCFRCRHEFMADGRVEGRP